MANLKSSNTAMNALCDSQNTGFGSNLIQNQVTFVTGTTGAIGSHTLATVTGTVLASVIPVVVSSGSGTNAVITLGTATSGSGIISNTTLTSLTNNVVWYNTSTFNPVVASSTIAKTILSENLIYKIAVGSGTGGTINFNILWTPISPDGKMTLFTTV